MKWWTAICCVAVLFLASCSAELKESHSTYVEEYGWTIKRALEKEALSLPDNEEQQMFMEERGLNVAELKTSKTLFTQEILLKEICREKLSAILYSDDKGKILGAQIRVENASPGVSKLVDKESYLKNCGR
ncbi:hypothetical protein A8F94_22655 [Bacillus sp. FJAT-27225]|uniref:hypothetical protein n=1 Tax=Bacillus sp. FJAT-27225 TaxID=1743144 RepID=UPI00080C3332|nr:hypothetical protein [Bacillus sp. FJAT-27225]OCA81662.1 hypothetical protein A8F94_22655 [Bacillus sp. FJAT-27225]